MQPPLIRRLDGHVEVGAQRERTDPVLEQRGITTRRVDITHVANDRQPRRHAAHIEEGRPYRIRPRIKTNRPREFLEHSDRIIPSGCHAYRRIAKHTLPVLVKSLVFAAR